MDNRLDTPWTALRFASASRRHSQDSTNSSTCWPIGLVRESLCRPAAATIDPDVHGSCRRDRTGRWYRDPHGLDARGRVVASAWLLGVALNLGFAGFYDVAVRDVVMSIAAFTLARLAEVRQPRSVSVFNSVSDHDRCGRVIA